MNMDSVREGFAAIKAGIKILDGGPLEYYLDRLTDCYDLLIQRFAPFAVGDTVELLETPVISATEAWGWMGGKHFLIKGALGKVREVDVDGEGFTAYVAFEEDSWIDSRNGRVNPRPAKERDTYGFRERWIRKCSTAQRQGDAK